MRRGAVIGGTAASFGRGDLGQHLKIQDNYLVGMIRECFQEDGENVVDVFEHFLGNVDEEVVYPLKGRYFGVHCAAQKLLGQHVDYGGKVKLVRLRRFYAVSVILTIEKWT